MRTCRGFQAIEDHVYYDSTTSPAHSHPIHPLFVNQSRVKTCCGFQASENPVYYDVNTLDNIPPFPGSFVYWPDADQQWQAPEQEAGKPGYYTTLTRPTRLHPDGVFT